MFNLIIKLITLLHFCNMPSNQDWKYNFLTQVVTTRTNCSDLNTPNIPTNPLLNLGDIIAFNIKHFFHVWKPYFCVFRKCKRAINFTQVRAYCTAREVTWNYKHWTDVFNDYRMRSFLSVWYHKSSCVLQITIWCIAAFNYLTSEMLQNELYLAFEACLAKHRFRKRMEA